MHIAKCLGFDSLGITPGKIPGENTKQKEVKAMTQTKVQTQNQIYDITERSRQWTIDEFLEIVDDSKCYNFEVWVENGKIFYTELL